MQIFVKTLVGTITLFSGISTANAEAHALCTGSSTCSQSHYLLPPAPYTGPYCTTTTSTYVHYNDCRDDDICPTLVGLCECLEFGLREEVHRLCPLMCNICQTTTTATTTTTYTTLTTTTTATTITVVGCVDQPTCPSQGGTCDCADKCDHQLVGERMRQECPVMCGVCGTTTTRTTTTTTTTTMEICEDDPRCPTRSGKPCDCHDKCWHPVTGEKLRFNCPVMCNVCATTVTFTTTTSTTTTTTTTTQTIAGACVDDPVCPTLVDSQGNDLCLCDTMGDIVRAACPVMCDRCHKCALPCMSDNLASKITMSEEANVDGKEASHCDDPDGIPQGNTCSMRPKTPVELVPNSYITHQCITGAVLLTCPTNNNMLMKSEKLKTHCQICGAVVGGDEDPRPGHITAEISFGPNSFDGIINEESVGILSYEVYAVNECGEREGRMLASVPARGIQQGKEECCAIGMYRTKGVATLPYGVTSASFMVVPVTSIGALDVGWVTPSPVIDSALQMTRATPAPAPAPTYGAMMEVEASTPAPTTTTTPAPKAAPTPAPDDDSLQIWLIVTACVFLLIIACVCVIMKLRKKPAPEPVHIPEPVHVPPPVIAPHKPKASGYCHECQSPHCYSLDDPNYKPAQGVDIAQVAPSRAPRGSKGRRGSKGTSDPRELAYDTKIAPA